MTSIERSISVSRGREPTFVVVGEPAIAAAAPANHRSDAGVRRADLVWHADLPGFGASVKRSAAIERRSREVWVSW
ncbi:MAG: hypothetical protein IIA73_03025 [Proteobacteria bacterium]|nr:hypothetical protein [Pseudomonadota bacterium]